jgi:GNAT superfamily N-acetyltransferase
MATAVSLVTFDPAFARDFARLNYQWIEEHFAVEEEDRVALEDPHAYAIATGGEIFFVLEDGLPVGTVAIVPCKDAGQRDVFELAKMAVRPDKRGCGYSHMLMQACIDFARSRDALEIMLVTNDALAPALGLYESSGFVAAPQYSDSRYVRGNLEMRLRLR